MSNYQQRKGRAEDSYGFTSGQPKLHVQEDVIEFSKAPFSELIKYKKF